MSPAFEPYADLIEKLNIPKQDLSLFKEEELKSLFYHYKDGTYAPYFKEDIRNEVNVFKPSTFLPFMKEFNIPYYPEKWLELVKRQMAKGNLHSNTISVFGKYLSWCYLFDIKNCEFKNSSWFPCDYSTYKNCEYIPNISFELKY